MTTTRRGRHRATPAPRTWPWQRRREPDPLIPFWAGVNAATDRDTDPAPRGVPLPAPNPSSLA